MKFNYILFKIQCDKSLLILYTSWEKQVRSQNGGPWAKGSRAVEEMLCSRFGTTDSCLREQSGKGTVTDCVIMRRPQIQRSRSFGAVTCSCVTEVEAAMCTRHKVAECSMEPKRDAARWRVKEMFANGIRGRYRGISFERKLWKVWQDWDHRSYGRQAEWGGDLLVLLLVIMLQLIKLSFRNAILVMRWLGSEDDPL